MFHAMVQLLVLRIVLRLYYGTKRKLFYEVYRNSLSGRVAAFLLGLVTHYRES